MSKITESARGMQCYVRIAGVCNGDPTTTVFAHYRLAGYCGTGIKPPDYMGAYACSACHDEVDGRTHRVFDSFDDKSNPLISIVAKDKVEKWFLEGVLRTQHKLVEKGLLKVTE